MAKKKEVVEEVEATEGAETTTDAAEVTPKAKKETRTSVTATYPGGERVFSLEIHGEDFMEVAKEFCETNKGEIA